MKRVGTGLWLSRLKIVQIGLRSGSCIINSDIGMGDRDRRQRMRKRAKLIKEVKKTQMLVSRGIRYSINTRMEVVVLRSKVRKLLIMIQFEMLERIGSN